MAGKTLDVTLKGHDQLSGVMREGRGAVTDFNQALEVGGKIVRTVQQIYAETVGEFIDYATEVRTLSSVTGQSAESSSRMIQVMDDFNISGDQVTTMLRMMAKEGLTPNIQTMATLSDRYLALAPGVERATFLQRNFGRSGADLALVMDQGSAAILDRNARVSEMLVLDEQALADAREMELAVDDLNDAWMGIELAFSRTVIPTLADLARGVAAVFQHEEGDNFVEWLQGIFVQGLEHSLGYVTPLTDGVGALTGALDDAAQAGEDLSYQQLLAAAMEAGLAGNTALESYYRRLAAEIRGARDALAAYIALAETNWSQWASESRFVIPPTPIGGGTAPGGGPAMGWAAFKAAYPGVAWFPGWVPGMAQGGPLGPITEVGEEGTEGVINGVVIPHGIWEQMKRLGIIPDQHAQDGGEKTNWRHGYWSSGIANVGTFIQTSTYAEAYAGGIAAYTSGGGMKTLADGGGGNIEAIVEEIKQAQAEESAALVASIPAAAAAAASEQGRMQVAETRSIGNDTITVLRRIERALDRLNDVFPTTVRDAVAAIQ
jgi:hypothetical protein